MAKGRDGVDRLEETRLACRHEATESQGLVVPFSKFVPELRMGI